MPCFNTDIPELTGFDTGLCLSNLATLEARQNRLQESFLAILSELADAILSDSGEDADTTDSILLSLLARADGEEAEEREEESVSPVNRDALKKLTSQAGITARMTLYRMLEEKRKATLSPERIPPLPVPVTARGRIAYMPSSFADKAYLVLSPLVSSPRASATAGFVDACEEVASGLCQFCILPIENSQSGKLTSFTRLILRYRLRIVAVCDLEDGSSEGQVTRFALLTSAHPEPPLSALPEQGKSTLLEIIHMTGPATLCELLVAAEFCGLRPLHVNTVPLTAADSPDGSDLPGVALDCVFSADGADVVTFRRYLSLEAPESFCGGLYTIHRPTL